MDTKHILGLISALQAKTKSREDLVNKELNLQADIDALEEELTTIQNDIRFLDQEIEDLEGDILSEAKEV